MALCEGHHVAVGRLESGWLVYRRPSGPVNTSVTPASGYVAAPGEVTFTTVQTDLGGGGDIKASYLLINATPDGRNAIYLYYDAVKNQLFLRNDANTAWHGGWRPVRNTTTTLRADLSRPRRARLLRETPHNQLALASTSP